MDESRKQFAEAFEELTGWELEDYPNQDYADTFWEFWEKSRAAIEIGLPEACSCCYSEPEKEWHDSVMSEVTDILRAAGIKVKE